MNIIACYEYIECLDSSEPTDDVVRFEYNEFIGQLKLQRGSLLYISKRLLMPNDILVRNDILVNIDSMDYNRATLEVCDANWHLLETYTLYPYLIHDNLRTEQTIIDLCEEIVKLRKQVKDLMSDVADVGPSEIKLPTSNMDVREQIDEINQHFKSIDKKVIFYGGKYHETLFGMDYDALTDKLYTAHILGTYVKKSNIMVLTETAYYIMKAFAS